MTGVIASPSLHGPYEDQLGLPIVGISGLPYTEYTARTQIEEPLRNKGFRPGEDGEAEEVSVFGTNSVGEVDTLLYVNLINAETPRAGPGIYGYAEAAVFG